MKFLHYFRKVILSAWLPSVHRRTTRFLYYQGKLLALHAVFSIALFIAVFWVVALPAMNFTAMYQRVVKSSLWGTQQYIPCIYVQKVSFSYSNSHLNVFEDGFLSRVSSLQHGLLEHIKEDKENFLIESSRFVASPSSQQLDEYSCLYFPHLLSYQDQYLSSFVTSTFLLKSADYTGIYDYFKSHAELNVFIHEAHDATLCGREGGLDYILIFVVYFVAFCYIWLSFRNVSMVKSKVGLGASALGIIFSSLIISTEIYAYMGKKFDYLSLDLTALLVTIIGVENFRSFIKAVVATPANLPVCDRIGIGLGNIGLSSHCALVFMVSILSIGIFSGIPALEEFCLFSAIALIIDHILQSTVALSILSIDIRRLDIPANPYVATDEKSEMVSASRKLFKKKFILTIILVLVMLGIALNFIYQSLSSPFMCSVFFDYCDLLYSQYSSTFQVTFLPTIHVLLKHQGEASIVIPSIKALSDSRIYLTLIGVVVFALLPIYMFLRYRNYFAKLFFYSDGWYNNWTFMNEFHRLKLLEGGTVDSFTASAKLICYGNERNTHLISLDGSQVFSVEKTSNYASFNHFHVFVYEDVIKFYDSTSQEIFSIDNPTCHGVVQFIDRNGIVYFCDESDCIFTINFHTKHVSAFKIERKPLVMYSCGQFISFLVDEEELWIATNVFDIKAKINASCKITFVAHFSKNLLFIGTAKGTTLIWDLTHQALLKTIKSSRGVEHAVFEILFDQISGKLVVSYIDGFVEIWTFRLINHYSGRNDVKSVRLVGKIMPFYNSSTCSKKVVRGISNSSNLILKDFLLFGVNSDNSLWIFDLYLCKLSKIIDLDVSLDCNVWIGMCENRIIYSFGGKIMCIFPSLPEVM